MTAPPRDTTAPATAVAGPRPEPTVRPPTSRVVERLLQISTLPLIVAVFGGLALFMARLAHRPVGLAGPVTLLAICLLCAAALAGTAAVLAVRQGRFNPAPAVASAIAVAGIAAAAPAWIFALRWLAILALAVMIAGLAVTARWGVKLQRRRAAYNRIAQALAPEVAQNQTQIEQVVAGLTKITNRLRITAPNFGAAPHAAWELKITRWDGPGVRAFDLVLPTHSDISNPDFLVRLKTALKNRCGFVDVKLSVDQTRDKITGTVLDEEETTEQPAEPKEAAADRAKTAAAQHLKGAHIKVLNWDPEGQPDDAPPSWPLQRFKLSYDQTPKTTGGNSRENFRIHMSLQLYDDEAALKDDWHLAEDYVIFTRRREFPKIIIHRPIDVAAAYGDRVIITHATTEDGDPIGWQVTDTDAPHELVAGPTGTGKSVDNRTVAMEAARLGDDVRILDPKRIEFMGLRGWPNVTAVATRVPAMVKVINDTFGDMMNRYTEIEENGAQAEDFRRITVIIDEFMMLNFLVNAYWAEIRDKSDPKEHPVFQKISALGVLARGANIRIRIASQRVDATLFNDNQLGGVRDSFAARWALGRQTQQGAGMMFGDTSVGRNIKPGSIGVGYMLGPFGLVLAKAHWLPDPARWNHPEKPLSAEHRQLLLDMLPPGTTWDGPEPYRPSQLDMPDSDSGDGGGGDPPVDPITRLLLLTRQALRSREAHLTDGITGGAPGTADNAAFYGWAIQGDAQAHRSGTWIGCVTETTAGSRVYLHPERVLEVVKQIAEPLGVPFNYTRKHLDEALHRSGKLKTEDRGGDKEGWTVRRQLPGNDLGLKSDRQRVWDLDAAEVLGDLPTAPAGYTAPADDTEPADSGQPGGGAEAGDGGTGPAGDTEPAGPRWKYAADLGEGDWIVLLQDGETIDAYVDDVVPWASETQTIPGPHPTADLVINYRRADNGEPGSRLAAPDQRIRLADPPAGAGAGKPAGP